MRISDWSSDVCSSDLVVPAGAGTIGYLQTIARHSRRLAAICNGAFILAQAGLLDGRRATTHWASARLLRERFPAVKVDEDRIFIADGSIWTSAGMTAGLDLALGMVDRKSTRLNSSH